LSVAYTVTYCCGRCPHRATLGQQVGPGRYTMKELWPRRPGALLFLLISYGLWAAVTLRWITEFIEQQHPLTWVISILLLLYGLLLGLEPVLTRGKPVRVHIYLAVQTLLIFAASLLFFELDFFAILYMPLSGQATLLLPQRQARAWLVLLIAFTIVGQVIQFGWPEALSFIILYTAALIFVAAFVTITMQAERSRRRSEELLADLQDAHEQLQQYAGQAEELATMKERNRLARELHDSVAQTLYGLSIQAEVASRRLDAGKIEEAQSNLAAIREGTQQSLAETRLLIFELQPPILQQEGLAAALRYRLDAVEGRSGLHISSDLASDRLSPTVEGALYAIALEALNNVIKHAQASEVHIALLCTDGRAQLVITDNGTGFEPGKQAGGLGLRSMQERAELLNGRFSITSTPGEGTKVAVEVPL